MSPLLISQSLRSKNSLNKINIFLIEQKNHIFKAIIAPSIRFHTWQAKNLGKDQDLINIYHNKDI